MDYSREIHESRLESIRRLCDLILSAIKAENGTRVVLLRHESRERERRKNELHRVEMQILEATLARYKQPKQ